MTQEKNSMDDKSVADAYRTLAGPNGDIALSSVLIGPIALIDWGVPAPIPEYFCNLSSLIESVVLRDRIVLLGGYKFDEPFVKTLADQGVLIDPISVVKNETTINGINTPQELLMPVLAGLIKTQSIVGVYLYNVEQFFKLAGLQNKFLPYHAQMEQKKAYDTVLSLTEKEPKSLEEYITTEFLRMMLREANLSRFVDFLVQFQIPSLLHAFDTPLVIERTRKSIFDRFKEQYRSKLVELTGLHPYPELINVEIPPLTTIVLERCKSDRKAISEVILSLREELKPARDFERAIAKKRNSASSWQEISEIHNDYEQWWRELSTKLGRGKTRWVHSVWNYVKLLNPGKMATKAVDALFSHEQEIEHYRAFHTYYSLWKEALNADFSDNAIKETFGVSIDPGKIYDYSQTYLVARSEWAKINKPITK